jgi:hypothetical protein
MSERAVTILEEAVAALRRKETEERLQQVLEQCRQVREETPALTDIALETEELANLLLGPEGVVLQSQLAVTKLIQMRKHTTELKRIGDLTRRQFEAFGRQGSVTRWWPKAPEDLPTSGQVLSEIEERERRIPEVQHRLIEMEQKRADIGRLERRVNQRLAELEISISTDQPLLVRNLLGTCSFPFWGWKDSKRSRRFF